MVIVIAGRAREPEVDVAIFTHISGTQSVLFRQLPTGSWRVCVCVVYRENVLREKCVVVLGVEGPQKSPYIFFETNVRFLERNLEGRRRILIF